MQSAIEIRHYLNRAGRDVFDGWLTSLRDARAQAKIAMRINRLAAGNFGDCSPCGTDCMNCGLTGGPVTACITR